MKPTQREILELKQKANADKINDLKKENYEISKQLCLLSDEIQQYKEEVEEHLVSKRPKRSQRFLIGRVHWKQFFKDESSDGGVWIDRSRIVRINGEWQF